MPDDELKARIKEMMVSSLMLKMPPGEIADDTPLFSPTGLALDSIDALELAVAIEKTFGVATPSAEVARKAFVNVNTIAPGVAAALATTVAGLIVAIPAMFGYNVLATRVKELTSAMELFANELLARLALRAAQQAAAPGALADV